MTETERRIFKRLRQLPPTRGLIALENACDKVRHTLGSKDLSPRYVEGEGSTRPLAMLIGEAPGAEEDVALRPFVGAAGRMLRQLMAVAGLYTDLQYADDGAGHAGSVQPNAWITNVVPYRPALNRTPTPLEIAAFRHKLRYEWSILGEPDVVIPIGGVAFRAVVGRQVSILAASGKPLPSPSRRVTLFPMVHPSFGLRGGNQLKDLIEKDWEVLGKWLYS